MLVVETPKPKALLATLRAMISDGSIQLWRVDNAGSFRYEAAQYKSLFAINSAEGPGKVVFKALGFKDKPPLTRAEKAIAYGRFAEELLAHFNKSDFTSLECAPLA